MSQPGEQPRLARWLRNDGEIVHRDDPICEIETDEASVDVPSPADGILRQLANPGDVIDTTREFWRIDPLR